MSHLPSTITLHNNVNHAWLRENWASKVRLKLTGIPMTESFVRWCFPLLYFPLKPSTIKSLYARFVELYFLWIYCIEKWENISWTGTCRNMIWKLFLRVLYWKIQSWKLYFNGELFSEFTLTMKFNCRHEFGNEKFTLNSKNRTCVTKLAIKMAFS